MEKDNIIENYYKNIDKPIINNYINKFNLKNLLELTTITDLCVFQNKKKNEWKLKDKRQILKECEVKRKIKIKEATKTVNLLAKNKSKEIINYIKEKNNNLFNEIENIDTLIETIEKDYPINDINFLETFSN